MTSMSKSLLLAIILAGVLAALPQTAAATPALHATRVDLSSPLGAAPDSARLQLAQSRGVGLFDFLFGSRRPSGGRVLRPPGRVPQGRAPARRAPSREPSAPVAGAPAAGGAASTAARAPNVAKADNAQRIVVIGDAFAFGLASELSQAYAATPNVVVVDRSKPGSGIVRDDFYDWTAAVEELAANEKMDAVVIMMGSNDRQNFRTGAQSTAAVRSDEWVAIYERRLKAIIRSFASRNIPVYWVGLPIMARAAYGQDMAFFNELFRRETVRVGGTFIDTWTRFADAEGKYNATGPDVNGQIRQLRHSNGIHLNRTGYQKLAFFVERELRLGASDGAIASYGKPQRQRVIGVEISLTEQEAGGGGQRLAGGPGAADEGIDIASEEAEESAAYKLLTLGQTPPPRGGRADAFPWPKDAADADIGPTVPPL